LIVTLKKMVRGTDFFLICQKSTNLERKGMTGSSAKSLKNVLHAFATKDVKASALTCRQSRRFGLSTVPAQLDRVLRECAVPH
jgi:hypothetical protein